MGLLTDVFNGAKALVFPDTVEPYKCKICKKWVKRKSKARRICKKCYNEME